MDKIVYNGFHKVWQTEVEIKGVKRIYEKLDIHNAVAGLVTDEDGKICLVTQYRIGAGRNIKEIPAGLIDKNLTNKEVLIEELIEECEIDEKDITYISENPILSYFMVVGSSECILEIYEVKVKRQHTKTVNDVDVELVEWITEEQFDEHVKNGEIVDNKTLLSYYYMKNEGK
ncbi:MAG TPA: hypothetical protein DEP72_05350 [Clostridiales bacterium]|nr:MAG: hypothetical protein A2Y18_01955 [Clostridiales bacterium GWD2_32_19]HCC07567.1 hypothetical protein [Clostridiales bacterium]